MERLNEFLANHFDTQASENFVKKACYYSSMDHIEYLSRDTITISDRIDEFLTVIWDRRYEHIIGFKLKGFKAAFEKVKLLKKFKGDEFNPLIQILELFITETAEDILCNLSEANERMNTYIDVKEFIIKENISLDESFAKAA
ncbi:hypothetical protein ACJJIE_13260 [Microbulbifer sp. TRSA001]|uniref:hypothetical protein n=1 Tax=Microbulbifer sp. TRSA001 TaxID=3243381 RepID=UPI00403942BF